MTNRNNHRGPVGWILKPSGLGAEQSAEVLGTTGGPVAKDLNVWPAVFREHTKIKGVRPCSMF